MKPLFLICLLSSLALINACKDKEEPVIATPVLEGGKGGDISIAVFTKYKNVGKDARIFLKYAADKHPGDTTLFDERSNTMVEPGYGPHAHFNSLKNGSYYIYCEAAGNLKVGSILILNDSSAKSKDIYLNFQ